MAVVGLVMWICRSIQLRSKVERNDRSCKYCPDQEFTNEHTLDNPVISQPKINSENVILIREKKVVNAQ